MNNIFELIRSEIGDEVMKKFIQNFKESLSTESKLNENKFLNIELSTSTTKFEGSSIEIKTFHEKTFSQIFQEDKSYMKTSAIIFSIQFDVKEESFVIIVKNIFESLYPYLTGNSSKIDYHVRSNGTTVNIDLWTTDKEKEEKISTHHVDWLKYFDASIMFKIGCSFSNIFALDFMEFIKQIIKFTVQIKGKITNFHYLAVAFRAGFQAIENKSNRFIKKCLLLIDMIESFENVNFNFIFEILNQWNKIEMFINELEEEKIVEGFEMLKSFIKIWGGDLIQPILEDFAILEHIKALNIDNISLFLTNTQTKNGFQAQFILPGLTKVLNEDIFG